MGALLPTAIALSNVSKQATVGLRMLRIRGRMERTVKLLQGTFVGLCAEISSEKRFRGGFEGGSLLPGGQRLADGEEVWTGFADEDFEDACE